jgi:hypothetical protein
MCVSSEVLGEFWMCNRNKENASNDGCDRLDVVFMTAPVAQLDRASGYEPEGRVFESLRAHH